MGAYTNWKANVLGTVVGDGQCVSLIVNNSRAYVEALFPGVSWPSIVAPVVGAKDMAGKGNSYLQWVANDHNNSSQLPPVGAIGVSDATPQSGYTNTYPNPFGHTWVFDSNISAAGFNAFQQNAPASGSPANVTYYSWKFRPVLGWYVPLAANPAPSPTPVPVGHTITLPATTGPWHLYNVGGPYNPAAAKGLLWPSLFGGLTYRVDNNRGNGIYTITTQNFGQGDIWTNGSYVIVK